MNKINGLDFAKALISGSNNLINNKNKIDALNVFPVPDGDTGTNMASTMEATLAFLKVNEEKNISKVLDEIAKKMLFGARGNSGVILSQIFRGFSNGIKDYESVSAKELLKGFEGAAKKAYSAVLKPIEGTILTVIRETYELLNKEYTNSKDDIEIADFFSKATAFARISCNNTPNKLKTLREVGVTDSGGEGLFCVIEGIYNYLIDKPIEISDEDCDVTKFINDTEVYDGEFGYCTEFIVDLTNFQKFDVDKFRNAMKKLATSLVVVNDENILKVHGHTLTPGKMLNFAQKFGEFIKIKSENMTLQANNSKGNAEKLKLQDNENKMALCGIVSCNLGTGIINKMVEYGCDYVIESGQTQNPSAQDIIDAINNVNAENVFVLANNSNIVLVSQQAAQVITDKNVFVIPTKTQVQGLTAILNFNKETSPEDNLEMMNEAIEEVSSIEVTQAVRTTKLNGVDIKKDQFISILNGKIIACQDNFIEAAKSAIEKVLDKDDSKELITIYYGDLVSELDANELLNWVQSQYDIEVEIYNGNQPNYHFLIGAE